ncbi:MAG: aminopeptidase P family N-terminal domain-containing protein, partial [Candidatus Humimicrobiaceae bacterium]
MEKEKTDLLVLRLSENVLFISGYFPMNGFSTLVLSSEADPVLIIPEGELEHAKERSKVGDIRTFGWGRITDIDPLISIMRNLASIKKGLFSGKNISIGMETGFETIAPSHIAGEVMVPGPSYRAMVEEVFCSPKIIDFIPILYELRAVKTEGELEKIKIANEITV